MGSSGDVAHTAMVDRLVTTLNSFLDSDLWKAFLICGGDGRVSIEGALEMLAIIRARAMNGQNSSLSYEAGRSSYTALRKSPFL